MMSDVSVLLIYKIKSLMMMMDICLLDTGHVMHVNDGSSSAAKLEYYVEQRAALGCQMRYLQESVLLRYVFSS